MELTRMIDPHHLDICRGLVDILTIALKISKGFGQREVIG